MGCGAAPPRPMMDAIVLESILEELRPLLLGRALSRPRAVAPQGIAFEVMGARRQRLWLDVRRDMAGLYLLGQDEARALSDEREADGATRHAVLLLRKHLEGRRISDLRRAVGERTVFLETSGATLVLRFVSRPSLTLVVDGAPVVGIGDGAQVWPLPEVRGETGDPAPPAGLAPMLLAPGPIDLCNDADLVPPSRVALASAPHPQSDRAVLRPTSWLAAAALLLQARTR